MISAANVPFSGISPGGVDMATGELILVLRPDLALDGPLPLVFTRYYASMLAREGLAAGHLGPNWLGAYDWTLSVSGTNATLVTNRGAAIHFAQSAAGGSWVLASPTYANFRLDLVGGLWRVTNPLDRRIYFFDGTSWRLIQIQDEHGNALALTYAGGLLTQVSDGLGRALSFQYDASGLLTGITDGTRTVSYGYTNGVLTGFTDAAGHAWTYAYSQAGPIQALLAGVVEPLGNEPVISNYDPSGRVASQMDALGGMVNYAYDTPTGNLYLDALGNPWGYQHDAQNRLATLTDPNGGPTSYGYDAQGRLSLYSRPLGDPTSFAYDPASGYPSTVTFADGSALQWGYGSHSVGGAMFFDLATALYPDQTSETYGRDASGNLTNFIDRGGFPWNGTYNARGQMLTWTNPTQGTTTFTYDRQGRPATEQDNAGNTAQLGYDALSRLIQVTWPDQSARHYAYDNLDHCTGLTDERTKVWSCGYDADGRLTSETDPLLETTGYGYDALDRVTQVTDPLNHARNYAYDPNGRLMSETDRSGRTTSYQYDALNRPVGIVDPMGGTDGFGYDADSRMTSSHDPLNHAWSYQYDALDRVTHVTDQVETGFDFGHDAMGRVTSETGPLGFSRTFRYDARGLLTAFIDGASETDYAYTPLGEVSQITDPNRNSWLRSYDAQGRIIADADPLGRGNGYGYDPMSRVIHIGRNDGSVQQIDYDPSSRVTACGFTGGPSFGYAYDDANRVLSATGASFAYDAAGRMTTSNGFAMTYDDEGRLLSETLAPGKVVSYDYDSRGLLAHVGDWMGGTTSFQYDAARRLTGMARPNGTTATFQYDAGDRLISAVEANPGPIQISSIAITRDALGRPTSIARRQPLMPGSTGAATNSFAYDAASQVTADTHDLLGRTTGDGSRSFQWDAASRLVHYAAGADSPSFAYDAFGQMLHSTNGSSTVQQAWTYGRGIPTVDDMQVSLPTRIRYHVHTPSGLPLYGVDGSSGVRSYYHYDEAGNTAYLTDEAGSVTAEYAYSPLGNVAAVGQTGDNSYTFGAGSGLMALGSSGLWTSPGGSVYDDRTMRVISGPAVSSGPALFMKTPGHPQVRSVVNPGPPGISAIINPGPPNSPPMNASMNVPLSGPMNSPMNGAVNGPLNGPMNGPLDGPMNGPLNGPMNGPTNGPLNPMNAPSDGPRDLAPAAWKNIHPPNPNRLRTGPIDINPGPIDFSEGTAFFRSVSGIKIESEASDYAEGGITTHVWTRAPGHGAFDPYMLLNQAIVLFNVVGVNNGHPVKKNPVRPFPYVPGGPGRVDPSPDAPIPWDGGKQVKIDFCKTDAGELLRERSSTPCKWCVLPNDGSAASGQATNDVNDVNR